MRRHLQGDLDQRHVHNNTAVMLVALWGCTHHYERNVNMLIMFLEVCGHLIGPNGSNYYSETSHFTGVVITITTDFLFLGLQTTPLYKSSDMLFYPAWCLCRISLSMSFQLLINLKQWHNNDFSDSRCFIRLAIWNTAVQWCDVRGNWPLCKCGQ